MPKKNKIQLPLWGTNPGRTQRLAQSIGAAEWADGSFFTTRDWMGDTQRDYARALLVQAQAARANGRPKIAKAYERMARNNGADAGQFKEYRSDVRGLGLSVG